MIAAFHLGGEEGFGLSTSLDGVKVIQAWAD